MRRRSPPPRACTEDRPAVITATCANTMEDTARLNDAIAGSNAGDLIQIHGACLVDQTIALYGNRSYSGDSLPKLPPEEAAPQSWKPGPHSHIE